MSSSLMTEIKTPTLPALKSLLTETSPPTPYPLDAFTCVMRGAVMAIAGHLQVPTAIAGQCVIGAITHLAQTRVNAWHPMGKPGGSPCSLFMLTLAGSGEGKSSARKLAFKPIDDAEKEARTRHRKECAEIEAMAAALKGKAREEFLLSNPLPPNPQTQYSDATFEPLAGEFIRGKPAVSWDTDEGGQMLGGSSLKADTVAATLGGLTKGFDDGYFERTRSKANQDGSGVAYNRRLGIQLLAQQATVAAALSDPLMREQGFLARFLFAAPDSLAGTRFITVESLARNAHDDLCLQQYWSRLKDIASSPEYIDLQTGEVTPPILRLNEDATQVWVDFRNEIEGEIGPLGMLASLKPFASRGAEQALRLATVMGCFEGVEHIDGNLMERACKLARYSLLEWLRYVEAGSVNPDMSRANDLVTWLLDPKRATSWQEFHVNKLGKSGPPALRLAQVRKKVLAILVSHNYLLTADGRQFKVNPLAKTADSAEIQEPHGFTDKDEVRKAADVTRIALVTRPSSAEPPQPPAKLPQAEAPQSQDLPQNPQEPQLPASAAPSDEQPCELSTLSTGRSEKL